MLPDDLFFRPKKEFWSIIYACTTSAFVMALISCFLLPKDSSLYIDMIGVQVLLGFSIFFFIWGSLFQKIGKHVGDLYGIWGLFFAGGGSAIKFIGVVNLLVTLVITPWDSLVMFYSDNLF